MSEVAGCYEAVAAWGDGLLLVVLDRDLTLMLLFLTVVTGSAYDEHILACADGVDSPDYIRSH